jgi:hypothetical protein
VAERERERGDEIASAFLDEIAEDCGDGWVTRNEGKYELGLEENRERNTTRFGGRSRERKRERRTERTHAFSVWWFSLRRAARERRCCRTSMRMMMMMGGGGNMDGRSSDEHHVVVGRMEMGPEGLRLLEDNGNRILYGEKVMAMAMFIAINWRIGFILCNRSSFRGRMERKSTKAAASPLLGFMALG